MSALVQIGVLFVRSSFLYCLLALYLLIDDTIVSGTHLVCRYRKYLG